MCNRTCVHALAHWALVFVPLPSCVLLSFFANLLPSFFFCRVIPPCIFFNLTNPSPGSFYCCLLLPFYPTSCLFSHSHHPFASILSTPTCVLWSDHMVNLIKRSSIRAPQLFPKGVFLSVFFACACVCVYVLVNNIQLFLSLYVSVRESNLSGLTGRSNNIRFRYVTLGYSSVADWEEMKFFCCVGWESAELFWS